MQMPWDILPHLQNFFQLNFLFSGLEVSSTTIFFARLIILLVFGAGLIWGAFKIIMKLLDCVQTFLAAIGPLPKSFFFLLLLIIPLSSESLGAKWIGYILLVMCLMGLAAIGTLMAVLWKYGVDQALRLINNLKSRSENTRAEARECAMPPDNIITPIINASRGSTPA